MKKIANCLILFLGVLILTGQVLPDNLYGQRRSRLHSKFQPGDAVSIEILEIMELQSTAADIDINDEYPIARDGTITMPLVGEIKVTGHNEESLIELLRQKFSPYFKEPYITVTPLIRITLMGAFNKPGSYRIDPEASLWELIEQAGGPQDNCDLNSMRVERGGQIVNEHLLASFEKGYSLEEIGVRSGDQIIAKSHNNFGMRDVMDYSRFIISLVVLYLQIQNLSN